MSRINVENLCFDIEKAFSSRLKPDLATNSIQLTEHELKSLSSIVSCNWESVTEHEWEQNFDALSWLSPESFCYYLPSILTLALKNNEPNLIVVVNLVSMLDRSPTPEWWDNFFLERWLLLTKDELLVIEKWLYWMIDCLNRAASDDSIERGLATVNFLINRSRTE